MSVNICVLCQNVYNMDDRIVEQRIVRDTEFCNVCWTEFMIESVDMIKLY
jgi:hypothetical protein